MSKGRRKAAVAANGVLETGTPTPDGANTKGPWRRPPQEIAEEYPS